MTEHFVIKSGRVIFPEGRVSAGFVAVCGPVIEEIGRGDIPAKYRDWEAVDVGSLVVSPGFVDLHVHGAGGWNFGQGAVPESILGGARYLASRGTTSFQPTVGVLPVPDMKASIAAAREAAKMENPGAEILGIHVEGPFVCSREPGVGTFDPRWILKPDLSVVDELLEAGEGSIKQMTIDPELAGAREVIVELKRRGIVVSGGHTNGTAEQMRAGVDRGITLVTHVYNAMRGLHHRDPGPLGWFLTDDRVVCELICDGIHVDPTAMRLVLLAKGLDRVCVISDSTAFAGLLPGRYASDGKVRNIDRAGRSTLDDGHISGSTKLQIHGVRNLVKLLGLSLVHAVRLASLNPVRVAGVQEQKGSLEPGKDADIIVFDDDFTVHYSFIKGRVAMSPNMEKKELLNPEYLKMMVAGEDPHA